MSVVQYIRRELWEADEANLIEEEDMHVFGLCPMTDPIELVRCNACKKPIKASHYAAHAELCRALSCSEEVELEHNSVKGHKQSPRKEREKSLTGSNQTKSGALQDIFRSPPAVNMVSSYQHLKETSSAEAKRNPLGRDVNGIADDGPKFSPGNTYCLDGHVLHDTKRK